MLPLVSPPSSENSDPVYKYDLSAVLFTPETLFEKRLGDYWVVFAPDMPGFPVVINARAHGILQRFRGGARASDVLATEPEFPFVMSTIGTLEEKGFLRGRPATLPYPTPALTGTPTSLSVWVHLTNQCNLTCHYCFVGKKTSSTMSDVDMETVVTNLANTATRHGIRELQIKFAGGEPTLFVPRMDRFRALLVKRIGQSDVQLRTSVLTNGTVLSARLLAFLEQPDTDISISLDGYGKHHDVFRVLRGSHKGTWSLIERHIDTLMDHGFPPYIMATISQETCESLPALLKWLHARRLAARLSVVRQPNGSWERRKGLADEYGEMCHRLADAFDNAFIDIEGPDYHFDLRRQLNICELSFKEPTPGVTCGIGSNHIIIRPDGTLVACPMTVSEQGKSSEGDLLETCKECFRYSASERYAPPDKDECLKCKWFPVCAGGCPITNLRMNGHPFSRSPLCQFYMKVIPRFVEFFGKKVIQASTKLGEPHSRSH